MVVKRGVNDDGIVALAERFRGTGDTLRFIEYMDVGHTQRLAPGRGRAGGRRSSRRIGAVWPLEPVAGRPDEVALRYRYRDGAGEIGVIALGDASPSAAAARARGCRRRARCTRACSPCAATTCARRSAPAPATTSLAATLRGVWGRRTDRYSELRTAETASLPKVEMSYIGG